MDRLRYFSYGSNMSTVRLRARCPSAALVGRAWLAGVSVAWNKVGMDGSAKCNIVEVVEGGVGIWGVVFELARVDLPTLRAAEGFPSHYGEHDVDVVLVDERSTTCMTYIARPAKIREGLVPAPDYLDHVLTGAREHGVPLEQLGVPQDWLTLLDG